MSEPGWRDRCSELARSAGREPADLIEWWAERAAIREVDGGQDRADAERAAFAELREAVGGYLGTDRKGPRSVADVGAVAATSERDTDAKPGS